MAGFFRGFNRKEITAEDEENKLRIVVYFEILWRKLYSFIGLNILYFIICLPMIGFLINYIYGATGAEAEVIADVSIYKVFGFLFNYNNWWTWALLGLSVIFYGPATCGLTYVFRNYTRREHAWTFSDFFTQLKDNFGKGLALGILDIMILLGVSMYLALDPSALAQGDKYMGVFKYIAIIVGFVYLMMRFYLYTMVVTFNMKFSSMIKNAWLFVVLGFFKNLLAAVTAGGLFVLCSASGFMIVTYAFFAFSLSRYTAIFITYPVLDKYMLKPMQKKSEIEMVEDENE